MALSCYDLVLVYRGTLCMQFNLKQQPGCTPTALDCVQISDGCRNMDQQQPVRSGGISSELYPVAGFVQLPAFKVSSSYKLRVENERPNRSSLP